MTNPDDRTYALAVIARHTRNDHTAWQGVAKVLGRSVADVKREYDLTIPAIPQAIILVAPTPAESGYPAMRLKILGFLIRWPSSTAECGANSTGARVEAVRARLSELSADGLVEHDEARGRATSRSWRASSAGRTFAKQHSPRSPSGAGKAA